MTVDYAINEILALVAVRPLAVPCPKCSAEVLEGCRFMSGDPDMPRPLEHMERRKHARDRFKSALEAIAGRE